MIESSWKLAHEYGQGCKVSLDANSISLNGNNARVKIKHYLVPPGTDKRNQKAVREVVFDKEFDLGKELTCYHSITFTYTDGLVAAPVGMEPKWVAADEGSLVELNFLRTLITPKKKAWWPF